VGGRHAPGVAAGSFVDIDQRIDIAHRLLIEMGETDHVRPADRQIHPDLFCKEFDLLRHEIGPVMQKSIPCFAR